MNSIRTIGGDGPEVWDRYRITLGDNGKPVNDLRVLYIAPEVGKDEEECVYVLGGPEPVLIGWPSGDRVASVEWTTNMSRFDPENKWIVNILERTDWDNLGVG